MSCTPTTSGKRGSIASRICWSAFPTGASRASRSNCRRDPTRAVTKTSSRVRSSWLSVTSLHPVGLNRLPLHQRVTAGFVAHPCREQFPANRKHDRADEKTDQAMGQRPAKDTDEDQHHRGL